MQNRPLIVLTPKQFDDILEEARLAGYAEKTAGHFALLGIGAASGFIVGLIVALLVR